MILSSLSFALMSAMVKLSGGRIPLMQQVFFRNLLIGIASFFILRREGKPLLGKPENRKLLFTRSLFGYLGVLAVFYSNSHMLLGDAQTLMKTTPFFTTLIAVLFLKERMTKTKAISLTLAFIGTVVVVRPEFSSSVIPAVVALLGALFAASAYTSIRALENREDVLTIIFFFSLFSCVVSLPFLIANFVVPTPREWLILLLIGVFAAGGQYFVTSAYTYAPASEVSIFDYSGIIFAPLLGWLLFREVLEPLSYLGMAMIVASGWVAFRQTRKEAEDRGG